MHAPFVRSGGALAGSPFLARLPLTSFVWLLADDAVGALDSCVVQAQPSVFGPTGKLATSTTTGNTGAGMRRGERLRSARGRRR